MDFLNMAHFSALILPQESVFHDNKFEPFALKIQQQICNHIFPKMAINNKLSRIA